MAAAAGLVLIPKAPLQLIILSVQVPAGIMLPSAIIFLQLLLNDKEMLGDQFANKSWNSSRGAQDIPGRSMARVRKLREKGFDHDSRKHN